VTKITAAILGCHIPLTRLAGMIPSRDKGKCHDRFEHIRKLTNDGLSIEELDAVTAGSFIGNLIAAARLEALVQYVRAHGKEIMATELH
jgi:hypothetical protein